MNPSWIPGLGPADPYGVHNLPYGSAVIPGAPDRRLVVRVGPHVLDVAAACAALRPDLLALTDAGTLDPLLKVDRSLWLDVRGAIQGWVTDPSNRRVIEPLLHAVTDCRLHLPFYVADYVDFYASEHHASNVGRLFRPGSPPLPVNWKHLPLGYHGRAGTIVVSGTDIVRPSGQRLGPAGPEFGASQQLDIESEVGFVLGSPTVMGDRVALADAAEHIFGVCLVNDWSARDIQAWESRPLGPFLGKSFATSISPWVVSLDALAPARIRTPERDVALLPYLDDSAIEPWGFRIVLEVWVNGVTVSRPPFESMYWTAAQMLAHLTVNGAAVRAGDLFASGTVSGPRRGEEGSLLELTRGGTEPVSLGDDARRSFLRDGDEVVISGEVPGIDGLPPIGLGEVAGRVVAH